MFCSGRAFQRYTDDNNPTVASDMASKNILLPLICGQTLENNISLQLFISLQADPCRFENLASDEPG